MKLFDSIQVSAPRRNKFDLSHERKFSFDMGNLVPILVQEILPGDRFRVTSELLIRLAPMLAPMMHRVNVYTHYFFVPNRLVWNEWESFITGGEDGLAAPLHPQMIIDSVNQGGIAANTLADYMGIPTPPPAMAGNCFFSALPFRAYTEIYNEYYRDQNLTPKVAYSKNSGNIVDFDKVGVLRKRAWEKDYFTSALPWSQRGQVVSIPNQTAVKIPALAMVTPTQQVVAAEAIGTSGAGPDTGSLKTLTSNQPIGIDIGGVTITINDLRKSARLQEYLELAARAGSRYVEHLKAFFGVRSSDARLQRPEYLGGGRQPVVISEVLSTFQQNSGTVDPAIIPQGNMSGHGISVGNTNGFSREFEEHGFVIGLMSVLPRTAYQQGLDRMFSRKTRYDYFVPQFANIGEQEVLNQELYYNFGTNTPNSTTFGYQSRYAEYKYKCSSVHGDFKNSLAYWHMGRIFAGPGAPALNTAFIESDPTTRIFAVEDAGVHHMYCQLHNAISAIRPMPYFNTPSL